MTIVGDGTVNLAVDSDGKFSTALPPGRYTVSGRSPLYDDGQRNCAGIPSSTVRVIERTSVSVVVACVEE